MSDREFMDLGDDWQDGAGREESGGWDPDLLEDFPDGDPAAEAIEVAAPAPPGARATEAASPVEAAAPVVPGPERRRAAPRRGHGTGGVGFLSFLLVLLAGLTLGAGLLTATGARPEALLDFSGFYDPATIGDFSAYPVNAFWLAVAVVLVAAMLAALSVDRRLRDLSRDGARDAAALAAVRRLDPEKPETWQQTDLQADPDLAAVTDSLLGHCNLQQARLTRYVDLEGELHRLETALAEGDRETLASNWDNPAAGSLADQAVQLLAAREEARLAVDERLQNIDARGPDLVSGLRDARTWQTGTLEQLNQQGTVAERVARQLARLAEQMPADDQRDRQRDRMRQALVAVQSELSNLPARPEQRREDDSPLAGAVERASRLAFQIAMEVARLGAKGERLLPLTQDLEELTTELRRSADPGGSEPGDDPRERAIEAVRGRLGELDPEVLGGPATGDLATKLQELAPLATQAAGGLAQVARTFPVQTSRIIELLELAGELTGLDTGGAGDPSASVSSSLSVDRFDPFGSESAPGSGLVADPFAQSSGSIFDAGGDGGDFSSAVLPGEDEPAPAEPLADVPAAASGSTLFGDPDPASEPPPLEVTAARDEVVAGVPSDAEKVYDLREFDAVRLPDTSGAADAEPVHDLREFGAERIG